MNASSDSVYFKENNCIELAEGAGYNHYYAILEASTNGIIRNYKAGVSDYDANASLKAQTLKRQELLLSISLRIRLRCIVSSIISL